MKCSGGVVRVPENDDNRDVVGGGDFCVQAMLERVEVRGGLVVRIEVNTGGVCGAEVVGKRGRGNDPLMIAEESCGEVDAFDGSGCREDLMRGVSEGLREQIDDVVAIC